MSSMFQALGVTISSDLQIKEFLCPAVRHPTPMVAENAWEVGGA